MRWRSLAQSGARGMLQMAKSAAGRAAAIAAGRGQACLDALRSLERVGITAYVACPAGDLVRRPRWCSPVSGSAPWRWPRPTCIIRLRSGADIAAVPLDDLDRVFVKPVDAQQFLWITGVKGIWARNRVGFEAVCKRLGWMGRISP